MEEERGMEAASPSDATASHEQDRESDRLVMYRTKHIQFLGRSTPIVLQNDNGPCPLLAICNVLLLRNAIQLEADSYEVSQDRLLHLVADRLLESNSNAKSKDEVYVSNQQQNISDAIDLLPRLATGIDVNVLFRKINDFEFTPECAIFDLLDIGLYHGWIVEPEDKETAVAIGSKSYNTLVGEIVSLESNNSGNEITIPEEDTVDFAAAKAATLGIPHPTFSKCSFDNPEVVIHEKVLRKGDLEEEAELIKALQISSVITSDNGGATSSVAFSSTLVEGTDVVPLMAQGQTEYVVEKKMEESDSSHRLELSLSHPQEKESPTFKFDSLHSGDITDNDMQYSGNMSTGYVNQTINEKVWNSSASGDAMSAEISDEKQNLSLLTPAMEEGDAGYKNNETNVVKENGSASESSSCPAEKQVGDLATFRCQPAPTACSGSAVGSEHINDTKSNCSGLEVTEPIYEGEECIIDSRHAAYENREPVYEGETILADNNTCHLQPKMEDSGEHHSGSTKITPREGQLIREFLKDNASQLTICGLFRLQEGLKEREICVFFRNNHFNTLFKYKDELYLLATDQGYINQPDLVWEKFNEVNGDSVFMTGDFKEFRVVDNQVNDNWSQQNTVAANCDYLPTFKDASIETTTINSDLQLAIALQKQEYEQQNQSQPQHPQNPQQPSGGAGRSSLIVGPQMPRSAPPVEKPDAKKEKCTLM